VETVACPRGKVRKSQETQKEIGGNDKKEGAVPGNWKEALVSRLVIAFAG
jgi:hypothetical protein